jgi:hypothetical protein
MNWRGGLLLERKLFSRDVDIRYKPIILRRDKSFWSICNAKSGIVIE